jgi:hypothetical protein
MKREFSFSLFPPFHFGPLAQLFPPACSPPPSLPLPGPAHPGQAVATLPVSLTDEQGTPVSRLPPSSESSTTDGNHRPRPRSIVGASSPRPAFKWGPAPDATPLVALPAPFFTRLSRNRSTTNHRSAVRHLRIAIDSKPPSSSFCR